jgi:hypothetical protein
MEADWEIEVGGGAAVIEALWSGFVDLRVHPERLSEIAEAVAFPALGKLLLALNSPTSPLWTAKCDVWTLDAEELSGMQVGLGCYVDLLPRADQVFAHWEQAEQLCRHWVRQLDELPLDPCRVELIVRQAIVGPLEGFGVTAYLSATAEDLPSACTMLDEACAALARILTGVSFPSAREEQSRPASAPI